EGLSPDFRQAIDAMHTIADSIMTLKILLSFIDLSIKNYKIIDIHHIIFLLCSYAKQSIMQLSYIWT
ncbi:MAG: hypothetical protein LBL24_05350, partial [Bacteroidales bacterium]|nr:hypothetical protein [Bacteroidales bacterium]